MMAFWWLLLGVFVFVLVVGYFSLKRLLVASEAAKARKLASAQRFADIPRRVAKKKSVYVPHLVDLLQKSFPNCADEIDEISIDSFYEATTEWRACYAADFTAEVHRERTLDNPDFPKFLQSDVIGTLPAKLRRVAESNFDEWFEKTNKVLKIATEKTLAEGTEI